MLDNTLEGESKLDVKKTVQTKLLSDEVNVVDQVESRRDSPLICSQTEGSSPTHVLDLLDRVSEASKKKLVIAEDEAVKLQTCLLSVGDGRDYVVAHKEKVL